MVEVTDLVRSWQAEVAKLDPRLRDLVVTADHGDFWHLSFELGETSHEATSGDLATFAFVDEAGYFEDEVPAAEVPRRIVQLFA